MVRAALSRWLYAPPVSGWPALVVGLIAIWVPTVVRLALNGVVTGCEFTPYLPFVLVCAILLRWWQAGAMALASVAILGGLFSGSTAHMACFVPAASIFLASSAVIIGVVILARWGMNQVRTTDDSSAGVVFSVDKGDVWASWRGQGAPVRLGPQGKVAHMMLDFLAGQKPDEQSTSG